MIAPESWFLVDYWVLSDDLKLASDFWRSLIYALNN
jgi:hypothetical protein